MDVITKDSVQEAVARGRFEGEVLTSLTDIKRVLGDMKEKHIAQDVKIDAKAEKEDVEQLKKRVWMLTGGAAVLGALLGKLF